jgi:branched-chain amino acid transport system substrate-binding protein
MKNLFKAAAVAALAIGFAQGAALAQNIKVGAFFSTTGPASFLGEPAQKTMQIYIEDLNKAGGLLGRKLELVSYDDGGDAAKANGFVKRLIEDDKVDVIVGGSTTGATMAVYPLVEKAEIPFVSVGGGVVISEPVKKWMFKVAPTDRAAAEKIFLDMKKRGLSRLALISETSGFGQSGRKETLGSAAKYGIEIVSDETYGAKDTDVTAQLTKIKGNDKAQALLVFGFGQGPAIVTKNIAQLGIKLPVYQSHGVAAKEYIDLSGAAAEGVRLPAGALLIPDILAANDPQKKAVTDYVTTFKARTNAEPATFGGYAYDALMIWANAVKRAGTVDKAKVRDEIEKTKGYVGATGVVNMSATDHLGLDLAAFKMLEIRKGNWALVE